MTNRALRKALLDKLDVTPQRLSQLAAKIKTNSGPMKTEEAIYCLAHRHGFDLTKFLPDSTVERVRQLLPRATEKPSSEKPARRPDKALAKIVNVAIGGKFNLANPILPQHVLSEAKEMAETVYPILYVFENSIRELILRVIRNKYGQNW